MLTGTEAVLSAALKASIEVEIAAACGAFPISPNCIDGLSSGISKAIIPHLVTNIITNAGQVVTGVTLVGPPGGPLPILAQPVVTTGTIS